MPTTDNITRLRGATLVDRDASGGVGHDVSGPTTDDAITRSRTP